MTICPTSGQFDQERTFPSFLPTNSMENPIPHSETHKSPQYESPGQNCTKKAIRAVTHNAICNFSENLPESEIFGVDSMANCERNPDMPLSPSCDSRRRSNSEFCNSKYQSGPFSNQKDLPMTLADHDKKNSMRNQISHPPTPFLAKSPLSETNGHDLAPDSVSVEQKSQKSNFFPNSNFQKAHGFSISQPISNPSTFCWYDLTQKSYNDFWIPKCQQTPTSTEIDLANLTSMDQSTNCMGSRLPHSKTPISMVSDLPSLHSEGFATYTEFAESNFQKPEKSMVSKIFCYDQMHKEEELKQMKSLKRCIDITGLLKNCKGHRSILGHY